MDTPLQQHIFQAIAASDSGSLSFADYMRLCLYHPDHGYYASPARRRIGRGGDFFTSVSVGAGFGFLLNLAAEQRWKARSDGAAPFAVVEQGAHDGQLALDFMAGVRERGGAWAEAVSYTIFDPDPARAAELRDCLNAAPDGEGEAIAVVSRIPETSAPCGLFLCNELLDAFPVHRLRRERGQWRELRVAAGDEGGALCWTSAILKEGSRLASEAGAIDASALADGYTTEVCLEIDPWIAETARWLERGSWWVIDYGHEEADFFAPGRRDGTLRCYRDHRMTDDPFETPGETDLTADVNFTRLDRAAAAQGLQRTEFTDQHHFLIRAAEPWLREIEAGGAAALTANRQRLHQFQTLTHPGLMGRAFKVAEYRRAASGGEDGRWGKAAQGESGTATQPQTPAT